MDSVRTKVIERYYIPVAKWTELQPPGESFLWFDDLSLFPLWHNCSAQAYQVVLKSLFKGDYEVQEK
jgi:hypothetical protein